MGQRGRRRTGRSPQVKRRTFRAQGVLPPSPEEISINSGTRSLLDKADAGRAAGFVVPARRRPVLSRLAAGMALGDRWGPSPGLGPGEPCGASGRAGGRGGGGGRVAGSLESRGAKTWRPRRGRGSRKKRRGRSLNPKTIIHTTISDTDIDRRSENRIHSLLPKTLVSNLC